MTNISYQAQEVDHADTVNVNDVIDNATFKPLHWYVLFWCLLVIIF